MIMRTCKKLCMHLAQHPMQLQPQLSVPKQLYLEDWLSTGPTSGGKASD